MATKKKTAPDTTPAPSDDALSTPEGTPLEVTATHIPYPSNLPNDFPNANGDSFTVPIRTLPHRPVRYVAGSHPDDVVIGGHLPPEADPTPLTPEQEAKLKDLVENPPPVDTEKIEALKDYLASAAPVDSVPDPKDFMKMNESFLSDFTNEHFESVVGSYLREREYEVLMDMAGKVPQILKFYLKAGTQLEVCRDDITGFVLREDHPEQIILSNGQTLDLATFSGGHAAKSKRNVEPYNLWQRERDPVKKLENLHNLIREGMESGTSKPWDVEEFLARMAAKSSKG